MNMPQAQLDELLKPLVKPAILLKLSKSEAAQAASCESKFGGLPYAEKEDTWAVCPTCENELTFVAQIKHPQEKSLLTFFYCFECFSWGGKDEEKGQWLIRSYQNPDMANYVEIKPTTEPEYEITPCCCAEQCIKTLPDYADLETLLPDAQALCGEDEPYQTYDEAAHRCDCVTGCGTLLGGYPEWVQGKTSKLCPVCGDEMEFFAQIDSEDDADLMWGDCGAVYLFRCAEHKNEFGFELQCY
jgi:uncharacterized protein YwqG